jgi:predicted polyphosphate/ATP-dependent NAD kinase
MERLGFVVNPIAGMGGRVGLKGTDGKVDRARELGAERRAPDRATEALVELHDIDGETEIVTYGGQMGADEAREAGFEPTVVGDPAGEETTAADTREAVRTFVEHGVDLILFVGGDGTAVDVAETLDDLDSTIPILGVPAGVKVYSAVFAVTPEAAARVAVLFDSTERAEVNDIDEDQYRAGEVHTELRALATVPVTDQRQGSKQLSAGTVAGVADWFADTVREGVTYVLGPGSTLGTIEERLGVEGTPLGVDVYRDGEVLARDAAESEILAALGEQNVVVVTPIGGQGFVFGRGNDQISPEVIRQCEVEIVASRRKLDDLGVLRVDTGDAEIDEQLRGWHRVRVGRYETRLMEIV